MYNLPAITFEKQRYCTIWTEAMSARAGNNIASAFICILNKIASDEPHINNIIFWSNSCVPQNRNSHILQAILEFLEYSLAGYSCVQKVDYMHKQIEHAMQVSEFYSPISFLRMLFKVNRKKTLSSNSDEQKQFQGFSQLFKKVAILHGSLHKNFSN